MYNTCYNSVFVFYLRFIELTILILFIKCFERKALEKDKTRMTEDSSCTCIHKYLKSTFWHVFYRRVENTHGHGQLVFRNCAKSNNNVKK